MKTKLSVRERLSLSQIFPQKDNLITMRIVNDLVNRLTIDADEAQQLGMKQKGQNIVWDTTKEKDKEFEFNDVELDIIKDSLKKLDEQKKVEATHVDLFDKFTK